ncbi:cytochrome P450 [Micromonospora sp. NBC_01655]|uniref:cytochrome P450 family protein n=1 Tax=Micromonospora sp. NBC_01655 TaxID=2975983 RepID=UPI00225AFB86|nr:cytochrome P450 [Micromonospora sp. NBC_01655]MCX4471706.1 cytochrome P450 [Micromonospora sp. NBC_01655]
MSTAEDELAPPRQAPFIVDPYPTLARIRANGPVSILHSDEGLPMWVVARYRDVRAVLADPRFGQDVRRAQELADDRVAGVPLGSDMVHMLNSDPPDHTRLRRLIHGFFTARRVAAMRPLVERVTTTLLDGIADRDTVDLVADFAFPLPMLVICELIGFPAEDRAAYRSWSTAILTHGDDPEAFGRALRELTDHIAVVLERRRTDPRDDLLTVLLVARDQGQLTDDEIVGMVFLLLIGGHETTVNLLGTATLALLRNPDQHAWLRQNRAALPMAVDEFLRYESPVSMATLRFTTEPVDVDGVEIPAGELVLVSLGGANRDPDRFPEADRLVLDRGDAGHLAFGHGLHRCLGAFLGKLEGEVALDALLSRFPGLTLAGTEADLRWRNTIMLRGLESLPVATHG